MPKNTPRAVMALLLLIAKLAIANAQTTETFTFSEMGYSNGATIELIKGESCTITFSKGTNYSDAPTYYANGQSIHFYTYNTLTISSSSRITSVAFTYSNTTNAPTDEDLIVSTGAYSFTNHTWSGDTNELTFTKNNQGKVYYITSIAVTVSGTVTTTMFTLDGQDVGGSTFTVYGGQESETNFKSPVATLTPVEAVADGGTITYESSNTAVAQIDEATGQVSFDSSTQYGTATITATFAGNSTYMRSSDSYTIVRNKYVGEPTAVSFGSAIDGKTIQTTNSSFSGYTATLSPAEAVADGGTITYESSNTAVATVNATTGHVNLADYGTATITASFAGIDGKWQASKASYTIVYMSPRLTFRYDSGSFDNLGTSYTEVEKQPSVMFIGDDGAEYQFTVSEAFREVYDGFYPDCIGLKTDFGKITSPLFEYVQGYTVVVEYAIDKGAKQQPSLTSGDAIGTYTLQSSQNGLGRYTAELDVESPKASFTFVAGSYYTRLLSIVIIPRANDVGVVNCDNIAEALAADSGTTVRLTLTNAIVEHASGTDAYLYDSTGAICMSGLPQGLLTTGSNVSGNITMTRSSDHGNSMLVANLLTTTNELTIDTDAAQPQPIVVEQMGNMATYANRLVTIGGKLSLEQQINSLTDGDKVIRINDLYSVITNMPFDDAALEITGIAAIYDSVAEIRPTSAQSMVIKLNEQLTDNTIEYMQHANVKISRYLSNEYWNTLCLPFNVPQAMIQEIFGQGTVLTKYSGIVQDHTMLFENSDEIEAGVPYLILPQLTADSPTFYDVTLSADPPQTVGDATSHRFVGIYNAYSMATNGTEVFIGTDGLLYVPSTAQDENTLYGMRAYIALPSAAEAQLTTISFNHATAIETPAAQKQGNVTIHSLSGQCMGTDPTVLPKGVYIRNGHKIIIK